MQQLLAAALEAMWAWLLHNAGATLDRVAAAFELVSTGLDDDHAFIRRSGANLALLTAGLRLPQHHASTLAAQRQSGADTQKLFEFVDPATAGFLLAKQVTGMPDDLLDLIAGDQISDHTILACHVPAAARPVLRALDQGYQPVLARTGPHARSQAATSTRDPPPEMPTSDEGVRTIRWLLDSGHHAVRGEDVAEDTRAELDELCRQKLAVHYDNAYRAGDIALYGVFRRQLPPPQLTDKYPGRSTDNTRESR